MDEFELIARIANLVPSGDVHTGIGDDAAVLPLTGDAYTLVTVDMQVEGVHFRRGPVPPYELGRRCIAVNVSDIAAMGGAPTYALVSLAVPASVDAAFVEALYRGIGYESIRYGLAIAGGNMSRIDGPLAIDVTMLGTVPSDQLVLRSGAQIGDTLAVTGSLGRAALARFAWQAPLSPPWPVPTARLEEGRALASAGIAHAMLDISDGLAGDLPHLCRASDVGAVLFGDALPMSTRSRDEARTLGLDWRHVALTGGEDYELLVALAETDLELARLLCPAGLTAIGQVLPAEAGVTIELPDGRVPLTTGGWRHF